MRAKFISNPLDPLSDPNTGGSDANFFPVTLFPSTNNADGSALAHLPPSSPGPLLAPTLPAESVEAQAAVAQNGSGGPGSVVAVAASSGFTINLIFDAAAMAAPASFRSGIEQAASILSATISNKITVNLNIDYSGTGGGAAAGPDNGLFESYSTVRTDLVNNAAPGDTTLPSGSTIQGQSQVAVWNAQLKLFGLLGPNDTTTDDGSATFATDISPSLLVGVALHELTHAMGRVPYGPQPDIFDFYRFTSPGARLFSNNIPASAAYFSVDGGNTKLADFGVSSDPSDFLNPPNSNLTPNDAFNEFYSGSTLQSLTTVDKEMLDALGFNTSPQGLVIATTAAEAVQGGAAVTLLSGPPNINDPSSATLSSATIEIVNAGNSVVAGDKLFVNGVQSGSVGNGVTASWNASTGTLTLTGGASIAVYDTLLSEVSYQDTGTDASSRSHPVRTVIWTVSDGTNSFSTTSQVSVDRPPVAHADAAVDKVGSTVATTAASGVLSNDSDLDGDKLTVTGVSDVANGTGSVGSSLAGVYGHLTLNAVGSYSYVADNSSAINAGPTGSHLQDVFAYTVSDGNGGTATASLTVTLERAPVVTATNVTLGSGQTSVAASSLFSVVDPDGNSIATYAFMDTGPGHFVLNGVVEANNQEIDVTAAQLSQLTYQSVAGSSIDSVQVRVNDGTLWSNWTSFTVTPPPVVIQTDGATNLVQVGADYFFDPAGGGTGPEFRYNGAALTVGEFNGWSPIGAVQTASGYDVAWKNTAAGLYTVWLTDSNGNFLSQPIGAVSGTSTVLEQYETIFNQDLNGDGKIGVPTVVIQTDGNTSLAQIGANYFFNPVGGGTGPEFKYNGAAVTSGEFGTWSPIGAVQTASGYDVAWKDSSSSLYTVWLTDSNGNFLSQPIGAVSGTSTVLEQYETTFNQDLNRDGKIGVPTVVIQTDGSTSLVQVGANYFFNPVGGGTGPEFKYNGAAVTSGEFGAFTPIGAVQTASGYDVAWKNTATGLYTVWLTDANGNFLSQPIGAVSGTSTVLEQYETTFNQDLNGDGVIGIPPATKPATVATAQNFQFADHGNASQTTIPGSSTAVVAIGETTNPAACGHDAFVFAPNLGQAAVANSTANTETFANLPVANVTSASSAQDEGHGNAVIATATHDAVFFDHATRAQLLAHQNDFHFAF
jgi:serralysin